MTRHTHGETQGASTFGLPSAAPNRGKSNDLVAGIYRDGPGGFGSCVTGERAMNIRWIHEVHEIPAGPASLRAALSDLDAQGKEVVSVIPNTGGRLMSMLGGGDVYGLLIVTRMPVPTPRTITVTRE